MPTTFNVIYLGLYTTEIDPFENNTLAEDASLLVGEVFGSANQPLYDRMGILAPSGNPYTVYDTDNNNVNDSYSVDGTVYTHDGLATYNATITYADGTTATVNEVIISQTTTGEVFLFPHMPGFEADQAILDAAPIQSITFGSVMMDDANLNVDRLGGFSGPVDGTDGDDTIGSGFTDANNDQIDGSDGNDDIIYGYYGNDTVNAGAGDDTIDGGFGGDSISGGSGDDLIVGDFGTDTLAAGTQHHYIKNAFIEGANYSTSSTGKFAWADVDNFDTIGDPITIRFTDNDAALDGDNTVNETANDLDQTVEVNGVEYNYALDFTLDYTDGSNTYTFAILDLDLDNDGAMNDDVDGGNGEVLLQLTGPAIASGTNLTLVPNSFVNVDTLDYAFYGSLAGENFNDTIDGGSGADTIDGQAGSDTILLSDSYGNDTISGGEDTDYSDIDVLDASNVTADGVNIVLSSSEAGTATSSQGTATFDGIEEFVLTDQADSFDGANATQALSISGGSGDDSIVGGDSDDDLEGNDGYDAISGGLGADMLDGGAGADTLIGGGGEDVFFGGAGDDDILLGNSDFALGGSGDDVFYIDPNDPLNQITAAYVDGGSDGTDGNGDDATNGNSGDLLDFSDQTNDLIFNFYPNSEDGEVDGFDTDFTDGYDLYFQNIERISTGFGDDTIDASGSTGGIDIDTGSGDDTVTGASGSDTLRGGDGSDTLDGGSGTDTLTGGTGADVFVANGDADVITDFDTITGIDGGASGDNDFVDLTSLYNSTTLAAWNAANPSQTYASALGWLRADQADGTLNEAGGLTIQNGGSSVAANDLSAENTGVVCFANGTLITTDRGEVPIETLQIGDPVLTGDHGLQPIRWIGSHYIGKQELDADPKLRPIRIRECATGVSGQTKDLIVSPQHRVLVTSDIVSRMFDRREVLVCAKQLLGIEGVEVASNIQELTYYHILFDHHEIVFANGVPSESLYLGTHAWATLTSEGRREIMSLFPELKMPAHCRAPCIPIIDGKPAKTLQLRHSKNQKPLNQFKGRYAVAKTSHGDAARLSA